MAAPIDNPVVLPPLDLGRQPNIDNLYQHILGIVQEPEVVSFQNTGMLAMQQMLHQQFQEQFQEQQERHQQLIAKLQLLTAAVNSIPMQLGNAIASADAPLLYPPGIAPAPFLPTTKNELGSLSAANCDASLAHLGLPAIAEEVPIAQRRQVLMDFLGSAMRA